MRELKAGTIVVLFQSKTYPHCSHFWRKVTTVPRSLTISPPVISIAMPAAFHDALRHPQRCPDDSTRRGRGAARSTRNVAWNKLDDAAYNFLDRVCGPAGKASGAVHIAEKFESLLERYRREDGGRWTGQDLDDATGGVVTRSYVSTLRKGRIQNPGFEKLRAIARAMGFPPELWFEEGGLAGTKVEKADGKSRLSDRVEHLFETVGRARTGEPYTSAEVARLILGGLTEDEVAGIRDGRIEDPSVGQIRALAEVFGISAAYLLHGTERTTPVDEEAIRALGDEKSRLLLLESFGLSEAEKDMLLDMIGHLKILRGPDEPAQRRAAPVKSS